MGVVLGIDIGGSTTKIAGFQESGQHIGTLRVEASDRLTSLYGAIGNFLSTRAISLNDVACCVITGVGAALVNGDIYGIHNDRQYCAQFDENTGVVTLRYSVGSAVIETYKK